MTDFLVSSELSSELSDSDSDSDSEVVCEGLLLEEEAKLFELFTFWLFWGGFFSIIMTAGLKAMFLLSIISSWWSLSESSDNLGLPKLTPGRLIAIKQSFEKLVSRKKCHIEVFFNKEQKIYHASDPFWLDRWPLWRKAHYAAEERKSIEH